MYEVHPSAALNAQFRQRPYQGAEPSTATFVFVGLDANYAPDLERSAVFRHVLEYHEDGVAFWRRHGVHHPFLLPDYRGDGRRYHRSFARIGFTPAHADQVSFVELLHVPSVGRSQLHPRDLDATHLQRLNDAILRGRARHVFVSSGVARLMRSSRAFAWLPEAPAGDGPLRVWHRGPDRTVYAHLHFSNFGRFEQQMQLEAQAIAALLPSHA